MSFVRIAGVLLTFAYLIVPAVCGTMLAESWARRLVVGWVVAVAASLLGLWASFTMDLPTGAAIVCASGVLLALLGIRGFVFVTVPEPCSQQPEGRITLICL